MKNTRPTYKSSVAVFFVAIFLFTLTACGSWAAGDYAAQLALVKEGRAQEALNALLPLKDGRMTDADFNTVYGMAALDSGLTAEGLAALERALALRPDDLAVRTELARAYAQLGDEAAAARELEIVKSQPETPQAVKANVRQYVDFLHQNLRGGPRTYTAEVTAGLGADSNVNMATTSGYIIIPSLAALGPAKLDSTATAQKSLVTQTSAKVAVRQPLSLAWALFGGMDAARTDVLADADYTQTTLAAEGGVQRLWAMGRAVSLGASARQFWYGGDAYSQTLALTGTWYEPLNAVFALTSNVSAAKSHYQTVAGQDALRLTAASTLDARLGGAGTPYVFGGVYGGTETAKDSMYSNMLGGLNVGVEVHPATAWVVYAQVQSELRDYNGVNPAFLKARNDWQTDVTVGGGYALSDNLSVRPSISYRHARSNIALYDYTRWQSLISLRYVLP